MGGVVNIVKPHRVTRSYTQSLTAPPDQVFPLLPLLLAKKGELSLADDQGGVPGRSIRLPLPLQMGLAKPEVTAIDASTGPEKVRILYLQRRVQVGGKSEVLDTQVRRVRKYPQIERQGLGREIGLTLQVTGAAVDPP